MKSPCPYCGNNPVPHRLTWYNESLNIWLTPLRQVLLYNFFTRFFKQKVWDQKLSRIFLSVGEALRIITRQDNIDICKVPRAKVLWEEAQKRGFKMQELLLFGKPFDTYIAARVEGIGGRVEKNIIFSGLPRPTGYTNNWLDLMDDKWLFKKLMMDNGLPVPKGGAAANFREAKRIFSNIQGLQPRALNLQPVITKPRSGSRGRHSTTFIYNEAELKSAFKVAQKLCHWVVVEEQLSGPIFRATVVNFELAGVLRGDPPQVVGDGERSIGELIEFKNSQPHTGVKDAVADDGMERFLERSVPTRLDLRQARQVHRRLKSPINGHGTSSVFNYVPQQGEVINLSEKIGVNYGGSSREDFEICHPDNKELFVKAAKVLGDPIVGFDFIIPNIAKSWKEQKCGFIEVNSLPFINLHHDPLLGKPRNVAAKVWDMAGF
jgi:hypothetical protein